MFKRRRHAVAATKGTDLPFCGMCGQAIRLDAATGRCALGHRVAAPAPAVAASPFDVADMAPPVDDFGAATGAYGDTEAVDPNYDLSDSPGFADQSDGVTWDELSTSDAQAAPAGPLDEFTPWDEPSDAESALDVDTSELPTAPETPVEEPATSGFLASDLLDELDDGFSRRRSVGTIGATIAVSGAVFGAVAVLPF